MIPSLTPIERVEADLRDLLANDIGTNPSAEAVANWVRGRFLRILELQNFENQFQSSYQNALEEKERRLAILELSRNLGATKRQLVRDARAFNGYFDRDAVLERVRRRIGEEERGAVFGLHHLGSLGLRCLHFKGVKDAIGEALVYPRDTRIRQAAFSCIRRTLENGSDLFVDEALLSQAQQAALQEGESTWVQCEALTILTYAAPTAAAEIVRRRIFNPQDKDDFFVRRHIVRLVARHAAFDQVYNDVFEQALRDPSPAVRQCLAEEFWRRAGSATNLASLLSSDPHPQVRAQLLSGTGCLLNTISMESVIDEIHRSVAQEPDSFVVRVAFHAISEWAWKDSTIAALLQTSLAPTLLERYSSSRDLQVRRYAAETLEQLWCAAHPYARPLAKEILEAIATLDEGAVVKIPALAKDNDANRQKVGRVLAVLAQRGFSLELLPGGKIRKGELFGFRSWRLLHEWRNPNSDKRQGFPHWIGRIWLGRVIAPSGIMAELAPTKVPGEPLFQPSEGNWRPWLPLPDMIISAIDTGDTVTIHSAEGVTEIVPPKTFWAQLRARTRLTWNFRRYAELRNWSADSGFLANSYVIALRELGVEIRLQALPERSNDPQVARFFSIGPAAMLVVPLFIQSVEVYLGSLYANTLAHLGFFLAAASALFFVNHILRSRAMRRARAGIPLVIGGWGTRGKSGTERLKAAVFTSLGHPFISKTTGNEAMFLYALPFGDIREMFLFRPYDKATIWEQLSLVVLAQKLRARIFIWECMGLTPSYVKILQRHWMRDDIATITNTYPDHEDVQGPAGRNIPIVMTNFIPENSALIISEEQMRPILVDAARRANTGVSSVGWLEAGLIPDEMMERFPYEEHPYNIALVTAMSRELGLGADVAVKEMADRVVQDVGALKVYPESVVDTRRLEFVLGNSANERFGALGNWARVGFDQHDPVSEPEVWITTVVNNRADRVPRSKVFASILVKDISANHHVLIGSNLEGLQGFIREAWTELAMSISLWPVDQEVPDPLSMLKLWAKKLRIIHDPVQLEQFLRVMIINQPDSSELLTRAASANQHDILSIILESGMPQALSIHEHYDRARKQLDEYRTIEKLVAAGGNRADVDRNFKEQAWRWFQAKFVVVDDYYATGEEIVRQLVNITPPGIRNRIMGMQNIKGTGLDFVYRWHAWEIVERTCRVALSDDTAQSQRALETLTEFLEYGILSRERVNATINEIRDRKNFGGEIVAAQLDLIQAKLDEQIALEESGNGNADGAGRFAPLLNWFESFLDAGDAVKRRKLANRIYAELAAERISTGRAVQELKRLNNRQKGGWLRKDLAKK